LRARIGSLERRVGRHGKVLAAAGAIAIPVGWGALRGRTRNLEDALAGVRRRLRALERKGVGVIAVAGVVAALAKIGATFIRCTNVKRTGRHLCGMDAGLLDALLLGTYAIVGGVSIVDLARGMQGITDESTELIRGFVRETSRGGA
jgi:putative intracellular protease/amidase